MGTRLRLYRRRRRWTREARATLILALPIMSGMVGQMLMGLADTIMVGRVGVVPLAAASFVNALTHLPLVFAFGLLSSLSVLASQAFGARRPEEAGEVLRHGLFLAGTAGTLVAASLAAVLPFLHVFGQPPEVISAAGTYLLLFGGSMLPALVAQAAKQFGEALNHPWEPTLILLGGVLLNILFNWILIYGNWGAPALGLNGAGWATLAARTITAVCAVAYIVRAPALRLFQPARWRARLSSGRLKALLRLGWPVGLQHLLEVSAFVLAAFMMGWISAEAIAAHQIAITCAATTFMFAFGIGMAVCIRVGHAWGAAQPERVRRIGYVGVALAVAVMGGFAIVFMTAGQFIAGLFVAAQAVAVLAGQLLFVAAIFQVADGVQVVAISALRGLTDVRFPAIIAALAYWAVAVPVAYSLAFLWDRGPVGIWIGLALGLGVAALALVWRFHCRSGSATLKALMVRPAPPGAETLIAGAKAVRIEDSVG